MVYTLKYLKEMGQRVGNSLKLSWKKSLFVLKLTFIYKFVITGSSGAAEMGMAQRPGEELAPRGRLAIWT